MSRIFAWVVSAAWLLLSGCATSRPQTCPPHDQRCEILQGISTISKAGE